MDDHDIEEAVRALAQEIDERSLPATPRRVRGAVSVSGPMTRWKLALPVLAVVVILVGVVVVTTVGGSEGSERLETATPTTESESPTTTTEPTTPASSTTSDVADTTTSAAPTTVVGTTTTPLPPATTTSTIPADCRNSFDRPECGPFHWDPAPAPNRPASLVVVAVEPDVLVVDQPITVTLRLHDPDTPFTIENCANAQAWYDGRAVPGCAIDPICGFREPTGPHDTPAEHESSFTVSYSHTYESPGTYDLAFSFFGGHDCSSPYAEQATVSLQITVDAAP